MLLANWLSISAVQLLDLVTINPLQRTEYLYIAWLKLVGAMRGKAPENDIVFITEFQDLERFVRGKAIADQNPWPAIGPVFSLAVRDVLNPIQSNCVVGISCVRAGRVPLRSEMCRPCVTMCRCWPDYERVR
jgi:hypothetical protein